MIGDPFTNELNRFCSRFSEKLAVLAAEEPDDGTDFVVGTLLDAIREVQAQLMLLEFEAERILSRA